MLFHKYNLSNIAKTTLLSMYPSVGCQQTLYTLSTYKLLGTQSSRHKIMSKCYIPYRRGVDEMVSPMHLNFTSIKNEPPSESVCSVHGDTHKLKCAGGDEEHPKLHCGKTGGKQFN